MIQISFGSEYEKRHIFILEVVETRLGLIEFCLRYFAGSQLKRSRYWEQFLQILSFNRMIQFHFELCSKIRSECQPTYNVF